MKPKTLYLQCAYLPWQRDGQKAELRMSEHHITPDLEFSPKMVIVHVRRYAGDVVIIDESWCDNEGAGIDNRYGRTRTLLNEYTRDYDAIRQGIKRFDTLVTERLQPMLILELDKECTCKPDSNACPSCQRLAKERTDMQEDADLPF